MIRRLVLIPILLAIWTALFAWAAAVSWRSPWAAHERLSLSGRNFQAKFGDASSDPGGLSVRALGDDGTGLQTVQVSRVRAEKYSVLRYRFKDFPGVLELAFVFRRSDAPDDVQTISLPAPGTGEVAVDLSRFGEWHGEITELGFAEYATAQLVPPSAATSFKPFVIQDAQLQASTWDSVVPRLRSDWFGYRPWAMQSINTIGPGIAVIGHSWMLPVFALGALLSWLAAWLVLGWSRGRAIKAACGVAVCAWVLLDLRWLDDLSAKHRLTEGIYAGKPWVERQTLQPDEGTLAAANELLRIVREQHVKRVLVHSDSTYTLLRFIYFLFPLNVAPLQQTMNEAPGAPLPGNALIAVFDSEWKYDESSGRLRDGKVEILAAPVYAKDDLRVFRPAGAAR